PAAGDDAPKMRELRRQLRTARELLPAEESLSQERGGSWNPWLASMTIDRLLLATLVDGKCDFQREGLVNRYLEFGRRASPREFASVMDNIRFLYALAARAETKESLVVAACLRVLMKDLGQEV
ncbi:MAG TPA: hypothetical protein PLZ16_09560, partial [Gammaproteobacteria bacterium]|nr:hypothetical protein [Gammaproteobacteria bacterium]